MSTQTQYMQLTKPAGSDSADITVINANMDKLDAHHHSGGTDGRAVVAVQSGTLANRPQPGTAGAVYVATDTNQLFFDNGSAWQTATSSSPPPSGSTSIPSGALMPYAGATAPDGWLLCCGQEVSRTTYSALFAAIGTAYGAGDGSTTFNVPDLRGRVPLGADNMGGTSANRVTATQADNLGQGAGEENHVLATGEMPAHGHSMTDPQHNHGVNDSGHTHNVPNYYGTGGGAGYGATDGNWEGANTTIAVSSSGTGISIQNQSTGISIQNTGGGGAHNNMPPYQTHNYIIKT